MNDRKRLLREQLRKEYDDLSATDRIKTDDELIARVLDFPLYKKCDRVFLFASMDTEVNTRDLIHTAYDSGKTVLLPKCYGKGIMEFFSSFNLTFVLYVPIKQLFTMRVLKIDQFVSLSNFKKDPSFGHQ